MSITEPQPLEKAEIIKEARRLGAELIGFAPVNRWAEQGDLSWEFDPQRLWPLTKTVIPIAIPSLLPVTETLEGDPLVDENLCGTCHNCEKICPVNALTDDKNERYARLDINACASQGKRLRQAFRNPCGYCIKVCPVGEDRQLFQSTNTQKYFDEAAALAANPHAPEYQDWLHIRKYGGHPLPEDPPSIR